MNKRQREIPNDEDNRFITIGELLNQKVSVAVLASAIEKHGVYTFDQFGRIKLADVERKASALNLLEIYHEWECIDPYERSYEETRSPMERWGCHSDNGYEHFGWAEKIAPDFLAIQRYEALGAEEDETEPPTDTKPTVHLNHDLGLQQKANVIAESMKTSNRIKDDESAVNDTTGTGKNLDGHEFAVFKEMDKLCFKEITICVDPDKFVLRISAREKKANIPFRLFGLNKKNEVTLNKQGKVFMDIANGTFSPDEKGVANALYRLSSSLREAFDTEDSPFLKNMSQFKCYISKDMEEKRRALKRTVSYDETIATKPYDITDDYLKREDPDYDTSNPMYSPDEGS